MALFDQASFDPQTYNGPSANHIGWLMQALKSGVLGNSVGGFPTQQDQPQTGPTYANGNQGMMGGVPFPIAGPAPQQEGAQLPPNAQPTGPAQTPQQPQPAFMGPEPSPGVGDRFSAFANNFSASHGLLAKLANAAQGAATGQRLDPLGMQQQQLQATYQALIKSGVPASVAQAAALNPEILKTIAPQIYTKPTFGVVSTDRYGNPVHGFIDPTAGKVTPYDPKNTLGTGTGGEGDPNLTGEAFLKTVPPAQAAQIKAMVEGRMAPFSGFVLKTPYGQKMLSDAAQYEPGFDFTTWAARNKTRSEFAAGGPNSPAGAITSGNTAIQHLGQLSDAADKLNNWGNIPFVNYRANQLANAVRTGSGASEVTNFEAIRNKYVEEATKFYRGVGGNESDLQRDIANLDAANSPKQLHEAIQAHAELMKSKISALQQRWTQTMGPNAGEFPIVQPKSQKALDLINQRAAGQAPQPQTGAPKIDEVRDGYRFRGGNPADKNNWAKVN